MDKELEQAVRARARNRCEYCLIPESLSKLAYAIDHVIARQHGGPTTLDNLALCCGRCNRHKGPNIAGIDPVSGQLMRLFNPRADAWSQHFRYAEAVLLGESPIGRATIAVLAINDPARVATRQALIDAGLFRRPG